MLAYLDDPMVKVDIIAQLQAHATADEIVQSVAWENGKGCAVGCTLHNYNHAEYETRFGIPEMLARLEDTIFEGLPNAKAKDWPIRFMGAIRPGADLSRVGWKFLHWLLTDKIVNPGIDHELVRDAVRSVADGIALLVDGQEWSAAESARSAAESARSAAESARSAAWSAARSAAWSAARSAAWSAARSAASAARSAASAARSAASAAESARSAASAAESARSAASAAESAISYERMADKLIALLAAA